MNSYNKKISEISSQEQFNNVLDFIIKDYENSLNFKYKKDNGCFYTNRLLAEDIVKKVIEQNNIDKKSLYKLTFLEPCSGVGVFVFAFLEYIKQLNYSRKNMLELLNNIYVSDIDEKALNIFKLLFCKYFELNYSLQITDDYFINHIGKGILFSRKENEVNYIDPKHVFNDGKNKFDIIITNPPYRISKAERKDYLNDEDYEKDKTFFTNLNKFAKEKCLLSSAGIINYYRIFTEEIIKNYTTNSFVGLLIPSSFLTDKSCFLLRDFIMKNNNLRLVDVLNENNKFLSAQQSLCSLIIETNSRTENIKVNADCLIDKNNYNDISYSDIISKIDNQPIISLTKDETDKFLKLLKFPKIKDLNFIKNSRGELDLTLYKSCILNISESKYRLIRGKDISQYKVNYKGSEYVDEKFLSKTQKIEDIKSVRIVGQQVVNQQKEHRLSFAKLEKNNILGNSCNYLVVKDNEYKITENFLLACLNSKLLNWYFKLQSSNNHVNNYEIDNLPIPINSKYIKEIDDLVNQYLEFKDTLILDQINKLVEDSYEIPSIDIKDNHNSNVLNRLYSDLKFLIKDFKLQDANDLLHCKKDISNFYPQFIIQNEINKKSANSILEKYISINDNLVLNNNTFKLSELDLEMIKNIPQGGNWKNIPLDVVKKSARLIRINETGGRTTLYGRIDYSKPCYTITTYFNRPGNGTNVHPIYDRVLSVREAARIQSFPDEFYFYGNKKDVLNQIGNAVPSLLAYNIIEKIKMKINVKNSLDLFAGAGGLSLGLKYAGINSSVVNDFDKSACITFKTNFPESEVIYGDITNEDIKKDIINESKKRKVDIICGGPPCQGFSLAGKRFIDDPRNTLFKHYIDVAKNVMPKVILFENVQGLLSFEKGKVYNQIIESFNDIGYNAVGKLLIASDYQVPQKRKRVIIIGTRKDLDINPKELYPEAIKNTPTAFDAIGDLEDIICDTKEKYKNKKSNYVNKLNLLFNSF